MGKSEAMKKADWSDTSPAELLEALLIGNPNTRQAYRYDLESFRRYVGAEDLAGTVKAFIESGPGLAKRKLLAWVDVMRDEGKTPNTARRRIGTMRRLVTLAADCEVIPWTLQMRLRLPTARPVRDTRGPSAADIREMLQRAHERTDAKGRRDEVILRLGYNCALRAGEMLSLDVGHVDLKTDVLAVKAKGKPGRTRLPMPRVVAKTLAAWLEVRPAGDGPLLITMDRTARARGELDRLTYRGLYNVVSSYAREAGVRCRPHGLRHAGITELARLTNGNLRLGMALSRHSDPRSYLAYCDVPGRGTRQAQELLASGRPTYDMRDS